MESKDGSKLRKLGPPVAVATGGCVDNSLSICSHKKVSTSPSGSVACPVKMKGVEMGTTIFPLVEVIVGAVLFKAVITSHWWPLLKISLLIS